MDFWNDMKRNITQTSQEAVQKAKDIAEISKLKSKQDELQRQITEIYIHIGQDITTEWKEHCSDDNVPEEFLLTQPCFRQVAENISKIIELQESENLIQERIITLQGYIKCPQCGKDIDSKAAFCQHCGYRMEQQTPNLRQCKHCGAPLLDDALFCVECGEKIEE